MTAKIIFQAFLIAWASICVYNTTRYKHNLFLACLSGVCGIVTIITLIKFTLEV